MKLIYKSVCILFIFFITHEAIIAQKWVNPHFDNHRIDFRDLGYPGATMLPADDTPIASLLAHSNGKVYGATSGNQSYLFVYDYMTNKVYPLGMIPGTAGVHNSLVEGADGLIYIGTGLNELEIITLTRDIPQGRRTIEIQLWEDIKNKYNDFEGGRLLVYDPEEGDGQVYLTDFEAVVQDLGLAVADNSIYAMAINDDKDRIYGISYPDGIFFEYNINEKTFRNHGELMRMFSYPGPERSWRGVSRSLICMPDGKVYTSGDNGVLVYFDPEDEKLHETTMRIPGEYWITRNYWGFPVVEQLLLDIDGSLIGSTSDGFIFKADPEAERIRVIGKPMVDRRVRAMTIAHDRRLYMICGQKDDVCRMFSYNLSDDNEGFLDYGVLGVDRSPYYAKMGYQFDAMVTAADGTVFIGESDRRAKLFFYVPGGKIMEGILNPTNPREP